MMIAAMARLVTFKINVLFTHSTVQCMPPTSGNGAVLVELQHRRLVGDMIPLRHVNITLRAQLGNNAQLQQHRMAD